ncbi:hypothetical protein GCM10007063_03190 [Lentibacillus kapialis]|uniref:SpoOB alpha-helical domain-containing protein n=1 Tax=Lentibacillus kapialis TaxID=340214 RepID=A0A917PM38_9BACI|nr:Spo0B domain-containing protein [Lentibacillus kapialis]GGJ84058.1 hypothetical protein GCM10007063_03190 [Lentibacillus kapialis]
MNETDVIQMLRHYRHDLMNHLQIVQGYLSMGKIEEAQKKLRNYTEELQEERKLVNLDAPRFALYILQFYFLHTNFRLTYHIRTVAENLQSVDELLAEQCEKIMERIVMSSDAMQLYELDILLYDADQDMIEVDFTLNGKIPDVQAFTKSIENIVGDVTIQHQDNEVKCRVRIP